MSRCFRFFLHFYGLGQDSETLKETHRADLHQLLAYCSFLPSKNKTGILFYPANNFGYRKINYLEQLGGIDNTVYLCGIPFGVKDIQSSAVKVRDIFN